MVSGPSTQPTRPTRVLLVEDDPTVADVLTNVLGAEGHVVECCTSAREALQRLGNEYFPVVITDLRLPDGLGTEVLRHSLRVHPHSSVVVVTGDSHFLTAEEAIREGAYTYIPKPFEPGKIRFVVRNAAERARLFDQCDRLEQWAMTDPLTGLGNRRKFELQIEQEVERSTRYGHPLSLLMVDVDTLKKCNDSLGHSFGDDMIRTVASVLLRAVRRVDTVSRYGGDEFGVVLPETAAEGAATAAGRCCLAVASMKGMSMPLSVSVGRTTLPDDAMTAADLVVLADRNMYAAREAGGNRYCPE